MSRRKCTYANGQSRGGTTGSSTNTEQRDGRAAKDYARVAIAFHGGDLAYEKYMKGGRKGYGQR
jgi:hypothetical protein